MIVSLVSSVCGARFDLQISLLLTASLLAGCWPTFAAVPSPSTLSLSPAAGGDPTTKTTANKTSRQITMPAANNDITSESTTIYETTSTTTPASVMTLGTSSINPKSKQTTAFFRNRATTISLNGTYAAIGARPTVDTPRGRLVEGGIKSVVIKRSRPADFMPTTTSTSMTTWGTGIGRLVFGPTTRREEIRSRTTAGVLPTTAQPRNASDVRKQKWRKIVELSAEAKKPLPSKPTLLNITNLLLSTVSNTSSKITFETIQTTTAQAKTRIVDKSTSPSATVVLFTGIKSDLTTTTEPTIIKETKRIMQLPDATTLLYDDNLIAPPTVKPRARTHAEDNHHQLGFPWPVKKEAVVEGDIVLGGLMMVHEREDSITCGPVMPQGGIQALEAMLYTLDKLNADTDQQLLPNITLGAHILDDCDKDTYGLEMAVDFIKG